MTNTTDLKEYEFHELILKKDDLYKTLAKLETKRDQWLTEIDVLKIRIREVNVELESR